ncbi:glycosyltransferase family 4 protein [Vibrio sp. SCSIO 43140]|uniref:glycosyltransferase family 4 protein n=1 Tax=Vibrio sp. SCSIO 43140 TaxID=2819100 RepID=UPI002075AB58|nr:glycosyltransferase family 4 protein [Vibrio sp. SCSIO 43140]USD60240.1 glycosyltransferase family 4 protein [Vibrio sp. SCSIO 43140]
MKYGVILPSLEKKGPNLVALDIITGLLELHTDIQIKVFYFRSSSNELSFPVETEKIGFFEKVDFSSFDVVHSHMMKPDIFVFFHKLIGRMKGTKTVTTLHQKDMVNLRYDYDSKTKAFLYSLVWRVCLSWHNHIVFLSDSMRRFYFPFFFNRNHSFIYNGRTFDSAEKVPKKKVSDQRYKLGVACLLTKRKGLEQVVNALAHLPDYEFHIAGDGPEKDSLMTLCREMGVEDRVVFRGFIDDTASFLGELDIFVLPSRGEGFPLALIEAAAQSKAIVVSDMDVVLEVFSSNEVKIFKMDDIDSLVNAIHGALHESQTLSKNIYKRYCQDFTATSMAKKYSHLFEALTKKH